MSHIIRHKAALMQRLARIRGQVEALSRAVDGEAECGDVLRQIASVRGAVNGLMAEVLEDHVRHHAMGGRRTSTRDIRAIDDVIEVIRSYLK